MLYDGLGAPGRRRRSGRGASTSLLRGGEMVGRGDSGFVTWLFLRKGGEKYRLFLPVLNEIAGEVDGHLDEEGRT